MLVFCFSRLVKYGLFPCAATEDFPLYFGTSLMEKWSFVFFWAACAVVISAAESELVSEMNGTGTKATEKASKTASKEVLHLVKCNRFMGFPPYSVMNCFL